MVGLTLIHIDNVWSKLEASHKVWKTQFWGLVCSEPRRTYQTPQVLALCYYRGTASGLKVLKYQKYQLQKFLNIYKNLLHVRNPNLWVRWHVLFKHYRVRESRWKKIGNKTIPSWSWKIFSVTKYFN